MQYSAWKQILFGKTTYCTSCPFSSFTVEGKWQPGQRHGSPNPCTVGMHMSLQMVLKTERHHTLLSTHYLCMRSVHTHTHTRMHTRVKNKACVVERKWCCSCSPDSRAAWHCSSVSLLLLPLQKGCGLIHSAAVFVGRDAILPSFQG